MLADVDRQYVTEYGIAEKQGRVYKVLNDWNLETTTMEKAADKTGATTASERRYSADVTSLGSSVSLQLHTEEATPTHKQEKGGTRSRRVSKKTEEK
jgi:hypothetical protein